MRSQEYNLAFVSQGAKDLHDALLRADIHTAECFVEQNDACLLSQRAGDEHPLALTAG